MAQLADGETTYIDASQLTAVTGPDAQKRHAVVDASGNYVASSAKMRRILMSSKMAPHKRRIEMEARYFLTSRTQVQWGSKYLTFG